jgi:hypothetical protein
MILAKPGEHPLMRQNRSPGSIGEHDDCYIILTFSRSSGPEYLDGFPV